MNREIKFRGKRVNGGEWVYGMTISNGTIKRKINNIFFEVAENKWVGVLPETLGQYTGLKDKDGKEIFEEDIVRFSYITDGIEPIEIECLAKVVFEDGSFMIKCVKGHVHNSMQRALFAMDYFNIKVEVVGNITDNPELMK